jgi:ATP-dependent Clp protease ATP-binding subunit ClpC
MSDAFITEENIILLCVVIIIVLLTVVLVYLLRKISGESSSTPTLDSFAKDITKMARDGKIDPVVGRKKEIDHLVTILSRRTKNNVVLIGEAGVGKTTIVEGLAQKIIDKNVTSDLFTKRVLALDLNSLIAGTKYRGEFEERVKKITEEISASSRKIILFIDEIHNLIRNEGMGESISVGDIFKPAMAKGDLQVIGATTPQEYEEYFKHDQAFKRRLQPIFVSEPNEEETLGILQGIKEKYEQHHSIKISNEALATCIVVARKIFPGRSFPDKAIDVMDETASRTRMGYIDKIGYDLTKIPTMKSADVMKVANEYKKMDGKTLRLIKNVEDRSSIPG